MGIILGGALQGAGAFGQQLQRDWSAENLEKMREEASTARQNALIEAQKLMQTAGFVHADVAAATAEERKRAPSIAAGRAMRGLINAPDRVISGDSPEGNIGDVTVSGKPSNKETSAAAIQAYLDAGGDAAGVSALRDMFKKEHISQAEGTRIVDAEGGVISEAQPKTAAPEAPGMAELRAAQADLARANAEYARGAKAELAAARAARLGTGGEGKPIGPNIKPIKGQDGDYLVDLNSGAVGVMVGEEKAKESVWHLFSKNEPATPAQLARTIWSTADGQPLPGGPFSLYKQLPVNAARDGQTPTDRPRVDPAMFDPNAKKPVASSGIIAPSNTKVMPPPHPQSVILPIVRAAARRGEQWALDELERRGVELDSTVPYMPPE